MRGEYQSLATNYGATIGSPPHARGIQTREGWSVTYCGFTPACAGNTLFPRLRTLRIQVHPRMRGEYYNVTFILYHLNGSPPHARGILQIIRLLQLCIRFTPACAGNTTKSIMMVLLSQVHPRMRGEYKFLSVRSKWCKGSPPHARGIHLEKCEKKRFFKLLHSKKI